MIKEKEKQRIQEDLNLSVWVLCRHPVLKLQNYYSMVSLYHLQALSTMMQILMVTDILCPSFYCPQLE